MSVTNSRSGKPVAPAVPAPGSRWLPIGSCLLLVALVFAVFYPVLGGAFLHWDDTPNISANLHLNGLGWRQLHWMFTDTTYMWRYSPLCWLTWSALKQWFGLNPVAFHLAVLAFHAVNAALVFLLIRKLLVLASTTADRTAGWEMTACATLAAALWAVHPLRVETTAWAVELEFVQPLCFFLLSLLCYLGARAASPVTTGAWRHWASVLLFAVSLASFPLALGGVAVFLALDLFPLRRLSLDPRNWWTPAAHGVWLQKIPFAVLTLIFGWMNLHSRLHQDTRWEPAPTLSEFSLTARVMQAFFVWAYNVWKPWWPAGLTPVRTELIAFDPLGWPFVLSAIVVIGLTAALVWKRRQWPGILAVWICHLALLVPMLGLSEHPHYAADRYSLAVDVAWAALLAGLFLRFWPRLPARLLLTGVAALAIALFSVMSRRQTFLWRTDVSFFTEILRRMPDDPRFALRRLDINLRLAAAYGDRGDLLAAENILQAEARDWPARPEVQQELGRTLAAEGNFAAAVTNFQTEARLVPNSPLPWNSLGVAYANDGKLDSAVSMFAEALRRDPENETALGNMAATLEMLGKPSEAVGYSNQLNAVKMRKQEK